MTMEGQEVFKFAVKQVPECIKEVLEETGNTAEDIDQFIIHQANYRIIESIAKRLKESANSVIYYGRIIYTSLADLLRGRESINDLSGPVGIVTAIGQAASYGWEDVAELLVLITINLGVFNLLPFPALDGGKIVFLLIEAVTGHAVPEKIQSSLTVAAFALLFGLMLFATYNDIVRLVTGAV